MCKHVPIVTIMFLYSISVWFLLLKQTKIHPLRDIVQNFILRQFYAYPSDTVLFVDQQQLMNTFLFIRFCVALENIQNKIKNVLKYHNFITTYIGNIFKCFC